MVDDDGHAQVLESVGVGLGVVRQEVAHEQAEILVQSALSLGGQSVEHQRRLARPRDAGKDGDLALGQAQRDVFQVVLARAADLNIFLGHERFLFSEPHNWLPTPPLVRTVRL